MLDVVRDFAPGMGQAVAERTILRRKENGTWESWGDVSHRVALGNSLLCPNETEQVDEYVVLNKHLRKMTTLMSGRHLQHGDENQPKKNLELHSNCSTASTSFLTFYLLMNGSGVGRCYDDDLMLVDWANMPHVLCVLDENHADFDSVNHLSVREAKHKLIGSDVVWFEVPDDREGWAKAVEVLEMMAWEGNHKDRVLVLDFSKVRKKGSPIGGMQGRPASGPCPLINAFRRVAMLKGCNMAPWRQAMYVDHLFAECVLVGGARRSARISCKSWRDKSVIDFVNVKRPVEFHGKPIEIVLGLRKAGNFNTFLWSSNNSILVDAEFWKLVKSEDRSELALHAKAVFEAIVCAAYGDGTGEPGFINQDKLVHNHEGLNIFKDSVFIGNSRYGLTETGKEFYRFMAAVVESKPLYMIVNPCGEISLNLLGAYCVIADMVPFFADTLEEAEDAFRVVTRALIRTNFMESLYGKEVKRTNRIGVGITGIHEFAWKFFGFNFYDLINEEKSKPFWLTMARFNRAVRDEAADYCRKHNLTYPHTLICSKPSGSVSKLCNITEGVHLPAKDCYLRWVQFSNTDPLVAKYRAAGYPTRELKTYKNTTIVGFPTRPLIGELGMNKLVLAAEATMEQQYKWLQLLEKYWIVGTDEAGNALADHGNQLSYTLKYDPDRVSLDEFRQAMLNHQANVKCCSVMPQEKSCSYEYLPEEVISEAEYLTIKSRIQPLAEDVDKVHVLCEGGACPVNFNK